MKKNDLHACYVILTYSSLIFKSMKRRTHEITQFHHKLVVRLTVGLPLMLKLGLLLSEAV